MPHRHLPGQVEIAFPHAADGADPVVGDVFKSRTGRDPTVGITLSRVINVITNGADIFFHEKSPKGKIGLIEPFFNYSIFVRQRIADRSIKRPSGYFCPKQAGGLQSPKSRSFLFLAEAQRTQRNLF